MSDENKEQNIEQRVQTFSLQIPTVKQIKSYLDKYVIGQDETKKVLAVAVHSHYKRIQAKMMSLAMPKEFSAVEIEKSNVLMLGPTGVGKTLLAKTLAKMLGVPFAIADATTLTAAGYVGEDVENVVRYLYQNANKNIPLTQIGIIYIDEIDKIASKTENVSITKDVGGECVQQTLLKIIEGTLCRFPENGGRKHPDQPLVEIDTTDILFICGGAFVGLDKIIASRTNKKVIGFGADANEEKHECADVQPQDLVKYGLIPEFVGRLPIITTLEELDEKDLVRIMSEPNNALIKQYKKLLYLDGIEFSVDIDAMKSIAKKAIERNTGARGLRAEFEKLLIDLIYDHEAKNNKIHLTKKLVDKKLN